MALIKGFGARELTKCASRLFLEDGLSIGGDGMFLRRINFRPAEPKDKPAYPFNIPAFRGVEMIRLTRPVTFLIGENGSGKSTLLEAVADRCGFYTGGGSRNHRFSYHATESELGERLVLSWSPKVSDGFFLRAETFYQLATYIDEVAKDGPNPERFYQLYGGRSLHAVSHGEAFLALFEHRFNQRGIYLLDEPEAALSPMRQLAFLRLIWQLEKTGQAQFIIATHSPVLLAYPGAAIYNLDESPLSLVEYEATEHYRLTREFLNDRRRFLRDLLQD